MNKSSTKTQEILYYSKGDEVTISDSGFKVKKTIYQLNGISGHCLSIVAPARVPYIVLMTMSVIIFACGAFNILPLDSVLTNFLVMAIGVALFATCLIVLIMAKEKYAVKIITAQGEKNVVVSQDHEYISQIVSALNRANFDLKLAGTK